MPRPRLSRSSVIDASTLDAVLFLPHGHFLTIDVPREFIESARQHWYRALDERGAREEYSIGVERLPRNPMARLLIRRLSPSSICSSPSTIAPLFAPASPPPSPAAKETAPEEPISPIPIPLSSWRFSFEVWLEREGKEDVTEEEFIAWHEEATRTRLETDPYSIPPSLSSALSEIFPSFAVQEDEESGFEILDKTFAAPKGEKE